MRVWHIGQNVSNLVCALLLEGIQIEHLLFLHFQMKIRVVIYTTSHNNNLMRPLELKKFFLNSDVANIVSTRPTKVGSLLGLAALIDYEISGLTRL